MNMRIKLAATLLQMRDELGQLLIPYEHAKKMSPEQIISLFQFDHYPIPAAEGGPDRPWNLMPRLIAAHRDKTRREDVPRIAKNKRVKGKHEAHVERMRLK